MHKTTLELPRNNFCILPAQCNYSATHLHYLDTFSFWLILCMLCLHIFAVKAMDPSAKQWRCSSWRLCLCSASGKAAMSPQLLSSLKYWWSEFFKNNRSHRTLLLLLGRKLIQTLSFDQCCSSLFWWEGVLTWDAWVFWTLHSPACKELVFLGKIEANGQLLFPMNHYRTPLMLYIQHALLHSPLRS